MPARLILNADDFGLTPGINRAVEELYRAGALTSATLMANGPAFDDAVEIARRNPGLSVGCHIVLTDGVPVSYPTDIPTLLGPNEKTFRPSVLDFFYDAARGAIKEDDICREAQAQVLKLQRAGIDVTHLDTHKHTHLLPRVARPLLFVAERARIGAIRNPFEQSWSLKLGKTDPIRRLQVRLLQPLQKRFEALPQIASQTVRTTNGTLGISATGRLDQPTLNALIANMPDGTWELVTHPGYNDRDLDAVTTRLRATREIEQQALLRTFLKNSQNPAGPELINYAAVGPFARLRELGQFEPNTGHEAYL